MQVPFTFGKIISGNSFVNRTKEIFRLSNNIESKINTILVSPRRWGKSSLMKQVSEKYSKDKKYIFCFMDMFNVRNEEEFYQLYAKRIIQSTSSKVDEWMNNIKTFLSKLSPVISMGLDPQTDFKIHMHIDIKDTSVLDIIDLPEKIAIQKKKTIVVCIDEFQGIENFNDPLGFQQKLRAQWQKHQNVVYCIYGSKRHMLMQLFESKSMPLYRFGDMFYLEKIPQEHFVKFIVKNFKKTNKLISVESSKELVQTVQSHPYYVQQLAYITWHQTTRKVTEHILKEAIDILLTTNLIVYRKEFENLSNDQVNFLMALKDGINDGYTRGEVIHKYNLGSSSNVIRIINALEKKEVIEKLGATIEFLDPVFELWLKTTNFER